MDHLRITLEGKTYDVVVEKLDGDQSVGTPAVVRAAAPAAAVARPPAPASKPAAGSGEVPSPLAGIVQAVSAQVGATVKEGELVITLEAMKMFTPINAPMSGTITEMLVKSGDAVEEGQILYTIG